MEFGCGAEKVGAVRGALGAWFQENARDLPWRRTRDPWRVLVSEVMLQQIQVKRAVPFYKRFLERFPTVRALAEAPLAEAIRAWGDLGRYRRVVNLHRTARIVVERHDGEIPSDPEVLVNLPGIGPYTAGAVACFAYERPVAFADTNVRRVLHRAFLGAEVPEPAASGAELRSLAEGLLPADGRDAWQWNQGLMELGALVCTARKPRCEACPLGDLCAARPVIRGALASLPESGAPTERYGGSNRHLRGRVLAALRVAPEGGVPVEALEGLVAGEENAARMRRAVRSLQSDGLVTVEEGPGRKHENPGGAGALAEEPSDYETGPKDPGDLSGGARVRLP